MPPGNPLGTYLKNRRTKLDPASFGLAGGRRRTPGLRREEVAQRANISATWYTWLEQGRGGQPSAEVLDRIAGALTLTEVEREHLFLIGLGRPPQVQYRVADAITPRLQRLLDILTHSPAVVRTATWDVVAWNRAAAAVLTDYSLLAPKQRNILRLMFSQARIRAMQTDWQAVARFVVASFRIDAARAGADAEIEQLVAELSETSPEFAAMWNDNNVQTHGDGLKQLHHPKVGCITLEYSSFAVDGRPDLSLLVYNPASEADRLLVETLMQPQG
ncbi:helix-turn-helix transcriptional regulator [Pseudomonas sp. dw_358]|uniref:helix-turn-helix transcriptional regulator n=1 Tax=Pseudomonas sp. dw_358 TaxID=2720083 RepID=UPI001BD2312D|nr:helix-turn-helix transcriptional regulator [Pseudomonas sp. dw_358]